MADGCGNSATVTYSTRIDNTPPVPVAGSIAGCYPTAAAAEAAAIAKIAKAKMRIRISLGLQTW